MQKTSAFAAAIGLTVAAALSVGHATAGEIDIQGVKVSWDDASLILPADCSRYQFTYANTSSQRLSKIEFEIVTQAGAKVGSESLLNVGPGVTGVWNERICRSALADGAGPYTLIWEVKDASGSERKSSAPLRFVLGTPTSSPSPSESASNKPSASPAPPQAKRVLCVNKKTAKKRTFQGQTKCPRGWVKA